MRLKFRLLKAEAEAHRMKVPDSTGVVRTLTTERFWAFRNLSEMIAPLAFGFQPTVSEPPASLVAEVAWICGASLLRATAKCAFDGLLGELSLDDIEFAYSLRDRANELDAQGVPDLAGRRYDAASFSFDDAGNFVFGTDKSWTWRDRLASVVRYCEKYQRPYGRQFPFDRPGTT